MQKKKIMIGIILISIFIAILLLILLQPKKINQIEQNYEMSKIQYSTQIGETVYDITNAISEVPNVPVISAGMIPVKKEDDNWVITVQEDWYDYQNGKPAYMMLNDGTYQSELLPNMGNKELANENINGTVDKSLGSIYMWVPRLAYNEVGDVVYINQECSISGDWILPEIFEYKIDGETKPNFSLSGIWVEYSTLINLNALNTKINNMQGENNQYGFIANTIAVKATDETTYVEVIDKFMNKIDSNYNINNKEDTNRTILKIINQRYVEAIKAKVIYEKENTKMKVQVIYNKNPIIRIVDEYGIDLIGLNEELTIAETGEDTIIGNSIYKFIIVDSDGNQKEVSIEITGEDVYIIKNEKTLKFFRDAVNSGKTTANTKAYQIADVKMNQGKYSVGDNIEDITFESDAEQWTPIRSYKGKYYGKNHSISGIYINTTADSQGLFSTFLGQVQDLTVENSYIKGKSNIGGIIGEITSNDASVRVDISNCKSNAKIEGTSNNVGGIVGSVNATNGYINLCENYSYVNGGKGYSGGIAGFSYNDIHYCCNFGKIVRSRCWWDFWIYAKKRNLLS